MPTDTASLELALGAVIDPELQLAIGQLGMLREIRAKRRRAVVVVALPLAKWPDEDELLARLQAVAGTVSGFEDVSLERVVMTEPERAHLRAALRQHMAGSDAGADAVGHDHAHGASTPTPAFLLPGSSTRVIGVSSGKGGVGKSSVTVNLAVALAQAGQRVGLLDADVYGFSVPKMLGAGRDPMVLGDIVVPTLVHGVRCLSMGFFVPDDEPVIWRGPMLHKAIEQFLVDAFWGDLDVLLVDMPPGTGDVTLSLAQVMPRTEVLVVTTPQPAAHRVAQRSAFAARKLKLSVRGVIENMSWFTGDDGVRYELFGSGGGQTVAADLGVPLLAQVPLVPALREGADDGQPVLVREPEGEAAQTFRALADRVVQLGPARVYRRELTVR
jgi:ATP-binding protein involved in chromosome partitioning